MIYVIRWFNPKFYFNNIWRQILWQESVPKIGVEQTKGNGKSYLYLYPIRDLVQGSFNRVRNFFTNSELKVN
jgi:hypothetical protein